MRKIQLFFRDSLTVSISKRVNVTLYVYGIPHVVHVMRNLPQYTTLEMSFC